MARVTPTVILKYPSLIVLNCFQHYVGCYKGTEMLFKSSLLKNWCTGKAWGPSPWTVLPENNHGARLLPWRKGFLSGEYPHVT